MTTSMQGKVCLVTGATRGLGQAAALQLAHMGAEVLIIGRSNVRIEDTLAALRQETGNTNVRGFQADLSSQTAVRRVAREILSQYGSLDVLINNVGATLLNYQSTVDGYEMTWALNYLNHFLLTHLLRDALISAAQQQGEARVVELTSSIYRISRDRFERLQKKAGYNGVLAYAQSKRAAIRFACELARRLKGTGVTANAVTPGLVRTDIATTSGWFYSGLMWLINHFALPLSKGVEPIVHLATSPEMRGVSGKYFYRFKERPVQPNGCDPQGGRKLWQLSEAMLGLDPAEQ